MILILYFCLASGACVEVRMRDVPADPCTGYYAQARAAEWAGEHEEYSLPGVAVPEG